MGIGLKTVNDLRGLLIQYLATKKCIDEGGFLTLFHALEGVFEKNEFEDIIENLLKTLSYKERKGDGILDEKMSMLWHAIGDEMSSLPDEYTFLLLLNACVSIFFIKVGRYIHVEVIRIRFQDLGVIRNLFIELHMT